MKVITNDKLVRRNRRLGQIATITGLVVLVGGMVISFRNPAYYGLSWIALFIGFALSQIGLYFGNRWGRHPRPDELLNEGLKGLNDQYSLFHFMTPAAHLLVGPSGMWVILPFHQRGRIVYEKGRWKQKGGGFMQKYLRIFAQEGIGRPDLEGPAEAAAINRFMKRKFPDTQVSEASLALVFTSENAQLEVENAPIPTLPLKKLKEMVRKAAKEKPMSPDLIREINLLFT